MSDGISGDDLEVSLEMPSWEKAFYKQIETLKEPFRDTDEFQTAKDYFKLGWMATDK